MIIERVEARPVPGCKSRRPFWHRPLSSLVVLCDPSRVTLGQVVNGILGNGADSDSGTGPRDVSVFEEQRMLSEPDWDDNLESTLESLNVTRGKFLSIVDDEGEYGTIQVAIGVLS